jgi:phosphatidylglycerophosphate synthase
VSVAADALGVVRLGTAALLPGALARADSRWFPAGLFVLAAATDFFDGVVARRGGGPTRHGALLDNVADIAFVLSGTISGAVLGLVPAAVPAAIGLAFGAYVLASLGGGRAARSSIGHGAGVLNYALTGFVAAAVAMPARVPAFVLRAGSAVVVAVNLAAVLDRLLPARS